MVSGPFAAIHTAATHNSNAAVQPAAPIVKVHLADLIVRVHPAAPIVRVHSAAPTS
jgi:hypothetical protein